MEKFLPDMNFVFVAQFPLRGPSSWGFICSPMPECEYCLWIIVLCCYRVTQTS